MHVAILGLCPFFFHNGCCQLAGCFPVKKALLSFLNDILNYHEMMDDADALSGDSLGTYLFDYYHVLLEKLTFMGSNNTLLTVLSVKRKPNCNTKRKCTYT